MGGAGGGAVAVAAAKEPLAEAWHRLRTPNLAALIRDIQVKLLPGENISRKLVYPDALLHASPCVYNLASCGSCIPPLLQHVRNAALASGVTGILGRKADTVSSVMMEPSRPDFCHPYQPYDIQLQFMHNLYQCIEKRQVGIFESPTGTGKSLSLICGALTWLRDHKRRAFDAAVEVDNTDDNTPEWMRLAEENQRREHLLQQRQELEAKLVAVRKAETSQAQKQITRPGAKRQRLNDDESVVGGSQDEEQYILAEYESDSEKQERSAGVTKAYTTDTQALLDQLKGIPSTEEEVTEPDEMKIIFCSRTHSQLTQFVNELRRVKPPSSILVVNDTNSRENAVDETVKHLPLGSRKSLCINPKVSSLGSAAAINERCLELQKAGTASTHKCSFLRSKDSKSKTEKFRNRTLAHVQDIEDLGRLGKALQICPYYASRSAIARSEIVTLPYPLLLQKSARDALGISIKNNVVMIDEAHNLMDAIAGLFSVSLSYRQLQVAVKQVVAYTQRFRNRLKGKNLAYVTQVIRLLNSIQDNLLRYFGNKKLSEYAVTAAQLMSGKGCDQIKPHRLIQYLQESKLAHKVEGFVDSRQDEKIPKSKGILMQLQSFLFVLINPDNEGRFFVTADGVDTSVRYALLDPREHFREVVEEARAVILAGGTMSPMSDYADYLFSYLSPERLLKISFGHVIPPSNLFAQAVVRGPSSTPFEFNYTNRSSEFLIVELQVLLMRICSNVPDGVVVFFPSYEYLAQVIETWTKLADGIQPLSRLKTVFTETRNAGVDELLRAYTQAIDTGTGAIMLSVVGGRLSEGINFSDKLGRAVIAIGLPFPNANGAEWKAKIDHVGRSKSSAALAQGKTEQDAGAIGIAAGSDFYENACMRAVNQCIGRAIRHKNDYAAILLVDRRFATERIAKKLPSWIKDNMDQEPTPKPWADIEDGLKKFFTNRA